VYPAKWHPVALATGREVETVCDLLPALAIGRGEAAKLLERSYSRTASVHGPIEPVD
jgi:hypothetical protein